MPQTTTIAIGALELEQAALNNEGARIYRWTASTRGPDRSNRIVEPEGWQLDDFRKNPVVTYGHEELLFPNAEPIARASSVQPTANGLTMEIVFASHSRATEIRKMVDEGFLNAMSVVWRGIEVERMTINNQPGVRYKRQTLLGASIVAIPDNPQALRQAASLYKQSAGANLAGTLNELINSRTSSEDERSDLISRMGSEAGITHSTVNQILNEGIDCPPIERLRGFARALSVSLDSLLAAARRDGCDYSESTEESSAITTLIRQELDSWKQQS